MRDVRRGVTCVDDDERPGESDRVLAAVLTGDDKAFRVLYRALHPRLLRYATALVGGEAEDVTAEAWLQIARDLHRFRGDIDAFRGWAATIVRNRAMDAVRASRRRPMDPVEVAALAEQPGPEDTAGCALEAISTREAIAMITALPRVEAEAVLLRAVVGLDAPSAGRVLGKRAGAVRIAAHRGLKRLAAEFDIPRQRQAPATEGGAR